MLSRLYKSLYMKFFLLFLVTCMLFFIGLALFWNYFFYHLFFKDKQNILQMRQDEVARLMQSYTDGTVATREVRFALRFIGRSVKGEAWVVDRSGRIVFSSVSEREGDEVPKPLNESLGMAIRGSAGFTTIRFIGGDSGQVESFFTSYNGLKQGGQPYAVFIFTPVDEILNAVFVVRWYIWLPMLFSLLAVALLLYTLSRKLAGPLRQMNEAALTLAEGDFSVRVPVRGDDEIAHLAQSFNFMLGKLQEWEDTRQEFLANVSHELRSPLTTLRGFIIGMNDNVIPPDQHSKYLKICDHEVQRLQRLVNDLLDLARIQNNVDVYRIVPFDAVRKTREIVDLVAPQIEDKGLKLEVWIPEDGEEPLTVKLDPDRYAQIVNNLLYNAVQFTAPGGEIKVFVGIDENDFLLTIRDSGKGMSEEETNRIFERFYKADPSRGARTEGTGLGLTIVQHLVKGMNGTISVSSEVGKGTEFTIRFPRPFPTAWE